MYLCRPKQTYSPEEWPDYDPIMAPNGYYQGAITNSAIWMPNWDHLKCHFYQNLVNAAVDVCLRDSSVSSMPSREELCKRVKDYLEGIAKMKKRPKAERDAKQPAPQNDPCQGKPRKSSLRAQSVIILTSIPHELERMDQNEFESNPLAHCRESEFIQAAFHQGILKSLFLVDYMEASVHGLSTSRNPLNSQNDEDLTADSNQYNELQVLCDLYEQERSPLELREPVSR